MGDPFKVVTVMMVMSLLRVKQTVMMDDVELMIMMLPTHGDHNVNVITIIEVVVMVTVTINSYASSSICIY